MAIFSTHTFFASCPTDWAKDCSMWTRLYCYTCQIKDIIQIWVTTAYYCVARARCVTSDFHCLLFFRQQKMKDCQLSFHFASQHFFKIYSFLIFSWILEAVHVPLLTCATGKSTVAWQTSRPACSHALSLSNNSAGLSPWNGQQEKRLCSSRIHNLDKKSKCSEFVLQGREQGTRQWSVGFLYFVQQYWF